MRNDKIIQVINRKLSSGVISHDFWPKALSVIPWYFCQIDLLKLHKQNLAKVNNRILG